jgi:hypothetical protein
MKFHTTKKEVMSNYKQVICISYCNAQNLLSAKSADAYTTRPEGWAADIYEFGNVAIVTGYAPFGNLTPGYNMVRKYDLLAEEIRYNNESTDINADLNKLLTSFILDVTTPKYFETFNGLHLLLDWSICNKYCIYKRTAERAARRLLPSLEILAGSDFLDGLVYTSSSSFAALWNGNTTARKRGTNLYLRGIAITTDGKPAACYIENDENGDELGMVYEVIK